MKTIAVILTFTFLKVTWGHLCLLSPPQRGSMLDLNKAAATDCILLKSPCGGRNEHGPPITLNSEERFVVTFQKNLDHFNSSTPGYFALNLMEEERPDAPVRQLAKIADSATPSLSLYSMNVTLPRVERPGPHVMQAVYVTNNPAAPPEFYQCADVIIMHRPHH